LAEPVIVERKRREAQIAEALRGAAREQAARLAAVILYGDPNGVV
jgi:hypothetical protein